MSENPDLEAALRDSLAALARRAPDGAGLTSRIEAAAHGPVAAPSAAGRRARGRWTLPLVAAASVAAVTTAAVGLSRLGDPVHHPARPVPAATGSSAASAAPVPAAPLPTPAASAPRSVAAPRSPAAVSLSGFRVSDLTFVGAEDGWALGTAACLDGSAGRCAAMMYTTDGGASWQSMRQPPADVPHPECATPCISHLRFASAEVGYAYGPSALFLTTDGGASWAPQPGGALGLESLNGTVIRVDTTPGCQPPGCQYRVQTAPVGSAAWQPVPVPGLQPGMATGIALARSGHGAYLVVFGHTTGGAQSATSQLFVSGDDGASWAGRGEPCPQVGDGPGGTEADTTAVSGAGDGSVSLLCSSRGSGHQFTATSTDGGHTFHPGPATALGPHPVTAFGAASASVLLASADAVYRSGDGGMSWRALPGTGPDSVAPASWLGFQTTTLGRAVTDGGATVATTRDGGLSWTAVTFP